MVDGILSSLIVAILVPLTIAAYKYTFLGAVIDQAVLPLFGKGANQEPTVKAFRKRLIRLLVADQSVLGPHKGQFGKATSLAESDRWQLPGSKEDVSVKPRMYLTFWPIHVLSKHQVAKRSLSFAFSGIEAIFQNQRVMVAQSASPHMSPLGVPQIVSYRHSMAGALVLAVKDPWNSITRSVVDAMLDPKNKWQKPNGGWRQVGDDFSGADLWASAYAAKLLDYCLDVDSPISSNERKRAEEVLDLTLQFLEESWLKNKWAAGKIVAEEGGPMLFIDTVAVLKKYKPELEASCIAAFESWLCLGGDLSDDYKKKLSTIPPVSLYARMAYAFYLSAPNLSHWKVLFERLSQHNPSELHSSELAFAIDMSYAYSINANKKIQPTSYVGG